MALPQDGQNANALATVKEVPTGKKLIFVDPTTNEGGVITLEDLTTQILKNLTSQTFALDQGTKTLPAALNELNSKASRFDGNIKKVGFRSGQRALNNIYLDFYDSNNSRTSLAFTTDGENAIKFLVNDEEKWKVVVK
jgi:hypothetical protein